MKNIVYIVSFLVSLAFVSCTKQNIQPTGNNTSSPVWRSASADDVQGGSTTSSTDGQGIIYPNDRDVVSGNGETSDGSSIVDPNNPDKGGDGNNISKGKKVKP